ncbi:hypothetical protein BASA83_007396 [Batrachochytrium salamandrivorans]|nr:hypothetical protein BASA83_007396 [Batrachochytrium salamandrivorans]
MSFGFANAPPHFQWVMNSIFSDMLGKFVLVYLDDIIYSPDPTSHVTHVRKVLDRLREKQLYCKLEKCFYGKHKLHYLGYIISSAGSRWIQRKLTQCKNNTATYCPTEKGYQVRLESDYRGFIQGTQKAFKDNVILTHADESQEFLVEVDASDFAVAGVLSQYNSQRDLQPLAFFSRQMVPAERNYEIYDKELLAIAMVAGYPRTTSGHMSQGIGTFHNGRHTFCRVLETEYPRSHIVQAGIEISVRQISSWTWTSQLSHLSDGNGLCARSSKDQSGNQHIITAIDYATRWVVAKAVPNRDSVTVASFLYELMMNYGSPFELFTDRGSSFISEGIREYEKLQRIRHHATTPYHPQTNGMVERMHATMGHAITTLTQGDDGPIKETMAPLDDVELMEERAELTAREFDELGQHRTAAYHRTEFTDNEQEDSDFGQEDFIEQENYDMENEEFIDQEDYYEQE